MSQSTPSELEVSRAETFYDHNGLAFTPHDLADVLPPLPDRYEFEGYYWIDELSGGWHGWHAVSLWGLEGWPLGWWPYIIVAACKINYSDGLVWGLATYTEGDIELWGFRHLEDVYTQIDTLAEMWWRSGYNPPDDLPAEGLGPQHKGPYLG